MAKRKTRERLNKDTLREVLLPVQITILEYLYERSGAQTAGEFSAKAGNLDQSSLSDYRHGKTLAIDNLPDIATRTCGLSSGNLSWFIGHHLMEQNKDHEFALAEQPGEIREPPAQYGLRLPNDQVEDVMSRDLRGLEPEDIRDLNLERRGIARLIKVCRGLLEAILKAIAVFEERYSAARRRARPHR